MSRHLEDIVVFLNPVDLHVGDTLRKLRIFRGVDAAEMADCLKISETLLFEYEGGAKRFSAEHLLAASQRLKVRSSLFFAGLREKLTQSLVSAEIYPEIARVGANDNRLRRLHGVRLKT